MKGRRKPKEGTKRLQTKYEGARTFEYETIEYWQSVMWTQGANGVAFRRPVSQSPADVWCYYNSRLNLTQCKTTLDTIPPRKDKEEEAKFIQYCKDLQAFCFWASRWKKNKNKYQRMIEIYNYGNQRWEVFIDDFSHRLKKSSSRI